MMSLPRTPLSVSFPSQPLFPRLPRGSQALFVDLEALAHNYRVICASVKKGTIVAAMVKTNAYGMGIEGSVPCLYATGCRHFFVMNLSEALEVKAGVGDAASIYVLEGPKCENEDIYASHNFIPVLNTLHQVKRWNDFCKQKGKHLRATIQFDTGMYRMGLSPQETKKMTSHDLAHTEISCVMSHLACPYAPAHPMNDVQLQRFAALRKRFPDGLASLASSGGSTFGHAYHYDMIRTGIGLTGCPSSGISGLKPALKAYAQILQIYEVKAGESVGYGAAFVASRDSQIASVAVGYGDNYFRALGNKGAEVYFQGQKLPLVGRVTMDTITIDVTGVSIAPGEWVELFGDNILAQDMAAKAETVSWELFTRLGPRFERFYI